MEIWIESQDEEYVAWEAIVNNAVEALLTALGELEAAEVNIVLTDDQTVQALNRQYRGMDRVTDVLSFSQLEGDDPGPDDGMLGDVVIAVPRAKEQAAEYGHSIPREVAFLAVHGVLHLLGWDHQEPEDEKQMMAKTEEILASIGLRRETC